MNHVVSILNSCVFILQGKTFLFNYQFKVQLNKSSIIFKTYVKMHGYDSNYFFDWFLCDTSCRKILGSIHEFAMARQNCIENCFFYKRKGKSYVGILFTTLQTFTGDYRDFTGAYPELVQGLKV